MSPAAGQHQSLSANGNWWKKPYYSDYRWGIAFEHGRLRWCDLLEKSESTIREEDLSFDLLAGLTPEAFASRGRLAPVGAVMTSLTEHPGKRAAGYFSDRMERWFHDYLASAQQPESYAKERFTRILSALILLRTIEDVRRIDWLSPGTLRDAAERGLGNVKQVLVRAGKELNSRVLQGVSDILPAGDSVRNLLHAFYEEDLDFSVLEADPVGAFYQKLLGTNYSLLEKAQSELFGKRMAVVSDRTARKTRGAYFTPREYADLLATRLVLPLARNARTPEELPIVIDLAAGSGQLLCAALRQIFSLPRWRDPKVVLHVLEHCIWAVDADPNAPQFAAQNVLRTAVQLVPEIVGSELRFPSLEKNFLHGNALQGHTLGRLPQADVVLLNPPFHGAKQWRDWMPEDDHFKGLSVLSSPAHSAFAFCLAGLEALRPGGDLGILMTHQPIHGPQSRTAREVIAKQLCLETVVVNEASQVIDDERSYLSVVLGHKVCGLERPRTQVISVSGPKGADIGALVAGAWGDSTTSRARLVTLSEEAPGDWIGGALHPEQSVALPQPSSRPLRVPRIPLRDLLGDEIHQPVSCAPEPWNRDLFLFEGDSDGGWTHLWGGSDDAGAKQTIRGASPRLRSVCIPNEMRTYPALTAPRSGRRGNLRVFFPDAGGVRIQDLRRDDPVGYELARAIKDAVLTTGDGNLASASIRFRDRIEGGVISFSWNRGYTDDNRPLLFLSQSATLHAGGNAELLMSCWIDFAGKFVPLGGNWLRVMHRKWAIALAVLLNVPAAVASLFGAGSRRNANTVQTSLSAQNDWAVPDFRSRLCESPLNDLELAYKAYSQKAKGLSREKALRIPEWRRMLQLGDRLWRL